MVMVRVLATMKMIGMVMWGRDGNGDGGGTGRGRGDGGGRAGREWWCPRYEAPSSMWACRRMRRAPRGVRAIITPRDNLEGAVAAWFDSGDNKNKGKT